MLAPGWLRSFRLPAKFHLEAFRKGFEQSMKGKNSTEQKEQNPAQVRKSETRGNRLRFEMGHTALDDSLVAAAGCQEEDAE